jgi:sodium/hydrogen exchanger 8
VSLSNNSSTESSISSTSTSIVSSIVSSISSSISSISSASSASSSESSSSSSSSSTQSRKDIIEQKEVTDFSNHQQTSKISEAILLIMFLLVLNEVLLNWFAKLRLHYSRFWVLRLISPTAITTTLGLLAGLTLDSMSQELLLHDLKAGFSQIFLIVLLPPILFESAINMETAPFFKNFGTINLYAVFGTLIATFITGLLLFVVGWLGLAVSMPFVVCMAFGALISATDPVAVLSLFKQMNTDKNLYALIFGESVLNDAVAIICFDSMIKSYG